MTQPPQDPAHYPQGHPAIAGYPAPPAPYAEWIQRVGGYLVDVAVLVPAYIPMVVGSVLMMAGDSGTVTSIGTVLYFLGVMAVIAVVVWNMIVRQGRTGWSIGKQVVGIRLVAERTGRPLGPGLTFVRMLVHVLDSLPCYLGYLWPLWDPKKQTFADKIMSTVVIVHRKV